MGISQVIARKAGQMPAEGLYKIARIQSRGGSTEAILLQSLHVMSDYLPDSVTNQVICMRQDKQGFGRQITCTAECGCSFQCL